MFRKKFIIKEISKKECGEFVQKYHYSPVFPRITKVWLGCFVKEELVGAITLGWGTQPKQTIKKMFPEMETNDYLEIGKMCMSEKMQKNSESQMLKSLVKWVKKNRPNVSMLYTMADGIMGKVGYVYQASNFLYGGLYWTDVYITKDGEKVHPRSMKKILAENAKFVGKEKLYWATPDYMETIGMKRIRGLMFRYMYPLTRQARKKMIANEWTNKNYPKEGDILWKQQTKYRKYEFIPQPKFTYFKSSVNNKNINQFKD